jgi:hypothetical protein
MKCEVYLNLLEEYIDGELSPDDHGQVAAHLITCASCAGRFAALTAEQELFARYDREIEVSPALWSGIAKQIVPVAETSVGWRTRLAELFTIRSLSFAGAVAVLLLAVTIGLFYFRKEEKKQSVTYKKESLSVPEQPVVATTEKPKPKPRPRIKRISKPVITTIDQSDILSSDLLDIDDQDTAKHIEQTQNLLRSIRNFQVSDSDEEIDVTYDKALSQRLLNENVVLRRDAEMKAKFPTKTLLADLEPFLIDIANLPDHAKPEDVRVIKERVQKTEIVAALTEYRDRGTNNR